MTVPFSSWGIAQQTKNSDNLTVCVCVSVCMCVCVTGLITAVVPVFHLYTPLRLGDASTCTPVRLIKLKPGLRPRTHLERVPPHMCGAYVACAVCVCVCVCVCV